MFLIWSYEQAELGFIEKKYKRHYKKSKKIFFSICIAWSSVTWSVCGVFHIYSKEEAAMMTGGTLISMGKSVLSYMNVERHTHAMKHEQNDEWWCGNATRKINDDLHPNKCHAY